LESENDQ
jgi:hypothetical protein